MKFFAVALSLTALATGAVAQLSILAPGGDGVWWVAKSDNVCSWTCRTSPYTEFTVLIANSNPQVLPSHLAFIAEQQNDQCSKLILSTQVDMPPGTGYTIQLANPLNNSDIYAESQPFEIKPLGSAYPASSATPTAPSTSTGSAPTGTNGTNAGTTPTGGSSQQDNDGGNGAASMFIPNGLAAAAALAVIGAMLA